MREDTKRMLSVLVMLGVLCSGAEASELNIVNESGNKYLVDASGDKYRAGGGTWYLKYDTIKHKHMENISSEVPFIRIRNNEIVNILCKDLQIDTSDRTASPISVIGNNAVLNIGSKDEAVGSVVLNYDKMFSMAAPILVNGNQRTNTAINFYADKMEIHQKKSDEDNTMAILTGDYMPNKSVVNINAKKSLYIEGDIGNGYHADWTVISKKPIFFGAKDSSVNINNEDGDNGDVQIVGNVYTANLKKESFDGNSINIKFATEASSLTGRVLDLTSADGAFWGAAAPAEKEGTHLTFDNSAMWNMTADSQITELDLKNNAAVLMGYGNENPLADGFRKLEIYNFKGSGGAINMNVDASANEKNSDRVYIDGTHSGTHYIALNNVAADGSTDGALGTVLVSVKNEQGEFKANDKEGALYWNKYELGKLEAANGDTVTDGYTVDWYLKDEKKTDKPTTTIEAALGSNALNYHTWRNDSDKLLQRVGELRLNGAEERGAWFRVKGSRLSRDGGFGFENKYKTYELGYDELVKNADGLKRYLGAALSYTDGSSTYNAGGGESHGKSIGLYSTDLYDKGHYLDLVFKVSDLDNDFSVYDTDKNRITSEASNFGISVSAEYGRKNELENGWFIEPQAQLTIGRLAGDTYATSNGVTVEQSDVTSVLGRVGINVGRRLGEKGIIYAKASLLHEFGGDYDVTMTNGADRVSIEDGFDDTWVEYGVGVAMQTGKNNHVYFDIERGSGGSFDKDWQWNAGARWSF